MGFCRKQCHRGRYCRGLVTGRDKTIAGGKKGDSLPFLPGLTVHQPDDRAYRIKRRNQYHCSEFVVCFTSRSINATISRVIHIRYAFTLQRVKTPQNAIQEATGLYMEATSNQQTFTGAPCTALCVLSLHKLSSKVPLLYPGSP